jgi:hypothetical protein
MRDGVREHPSYLNFGRFILRTHPPRVNEGFDTAPMSLPENRCRACRKWKTDRMFRRFLRRKDD